MNKTKLKVVEGIERMKEIMKKNGMSNLALSRQINISFITSRKVLEELVSLGILKKFGRSGGSRYFLVNEEKLEEYKNSLLKS